MLLVRNGTQVSFQLEHAQPRLLLLDVRLRGLNGLEFCKQVREQQQLSGEHLGIILLSAVADDEEILACQSAGADGFISKPFDLEDLLARIKTAMNNRNQVDFARVLEPAQLQGASAV